MAGYLVRRLVRMLMALFGVSAIIFLIMRLLPGDPAQLILGEFATEEALAQLRRSLGLDQPLWKQFVDYWGQLARGDFGRSLVTRRPVVEDVFQAFPYTLQLAFASLIVAVLAGVPIGVVSALRRNSLLDRASMLLALIGVAGPDFWYGILGLLVFSTWLGWYPLLGTSLAGGSGAALKYVFLPAAVLGFSMAGLIARITRSSLLEELGRDYTRTARAKGLAEHVVTIKHALRNALIPLVTVVGSNVGRLLGGTVIIEVTFVRPGLGQLLMQSIMQRDYPVIQGLTLFFAAMVILVNFLIDLSYRILDPRMEYR